MLFLSFFKIKRWISVYNDSSLFFRACRLNLIQPYFEGCFQGYFSVVMRSVAGYVTNNNRKRDRKEAQKGDDKNLKEENLNRL